MIEKGNLVQPEDKYQIRNPWIPLTPDQVLFRSNGISVDRNGNQLRMRNRSELSELLNGCSEQTSNYNRAGDNVNLHGRLNQSSSSYGISDHRMGNGIFTSGNGSNLTVPLNQSNHSYDVNNSQMGNGIFTGGNRSNLTVLLDQSSSSYNMSNNYQMENGNFTRGSRSNLTVPLNQSSGSYDISSYQMRNGIVQGGNNYNQISSSNSMVDHRMGNGNLGTYLNSQTQSYHNDIPPWSNNPVASNRGQSVNTVQQTSFPATNITQIMISKTDSVISSPLLNLNMRPLSPPRGMNSHKNLPNAPSILNSYSKVDNSWTEGNFTSLLLGNEILDLGPNKLYHSNNSPQMLNYGFHDPLQQCNLNSPPRVGGNTGTSNANSFPFTPITPDHTNLLEKHRQAQMLKFMANDSSCQEHDKMENLLSSIGKETIDNHCSELLQTIVGSSSTVVSTLQTENKISEGRSDQNVIDLNETPKQKAPKRRKHRPKVVIEGKPKRTPKAKTPNSESEKNPSRKRKYVRKNRDQEVENTTPQQTDVINTVTHPSFASQKESCRKRLNFDFENSKEGESQHTAAQIQVAHHQSNQQVLDLNMSFAVNQMLVKNLAGEENHAPATSSEIINYNPLNTMARNLSKKNKENRTPRKSKGESNKNISRTNLQLERSTEMRWKNTHQMVERDVGNFKGFCASKGEGFQQIEQVSPSSDHNLSFSSICQEPFQTGNKETISTEVGNSSEETRKKQKMENDFQTLLSAPEKRDHTNGASGESTTIADNHMQTALNQQMMVLKKMRESIPSRSNQKHSTSCLAVVTNSNLQSAITSKKTNASCYQQGTENNQASMQNNRLNMTANPCREVSFCTNKVPLQEREDTIHQYHQPSKTARGRPKVIKYSKKMVDEITFRLQSLRISGENIETGRKDKYALVPYEGGGAVVPYEPKKRKPRPKVDLDPETDRIWKLLMGKEGTETSETENRHKEKWWEEERRVFHGRAESFIARMHLVQGNRRFSPWKGSVVDSVIGVFLTQNVSDQLSSSAFMALAAQFPLGLATHAQASDQSGTSVVTDELGIQGIASCGTVGRFDKIISQPFYSQTSEPYLRRMGLASESNRITEENASSSQNSSASSIHHINVEIQSSSGSSSEAENSSNGGKPIENIGLMSVNHANIASPLPAVKNPENKELCFDDSSMLYYKQSSELDPNKQVQGSDKFNNLNSFPPSNQPLGYSISSMQNSNNPMSYFQLLMAPEVARTETDCCEISREECRSSFPSKAPAMTKGKSISYQDNRVGQTEDAMSNTLLQQNRLKNSQNPNIDPFAFLLKHVTVQKSSVHQESQIVPLSLNSRQVERSQIYESENTGFGNLGGLVEPVITRKSGSGNQVPSVSKHNGQIDDSHEGTIAANKQVFLGDRSSDELEISGEINIGVSSKTLKTSQKHEKEKRESFDWDSLRKTVQLNGGVKQRSIDSSDSMDYEAMRCADVNVISNSIRIRGMNNMLAERIKGFLNRVVTDHGSIDLEWLRDVPPDKAKDYLLSIRGLGLKSVECVRLLTLHHLAFPVDTNVGRIAVRLGWVPLQPLPESLQLHLLEMYPVLETVQKYLWPRLCKLDQKTLYELHYQLITFGKVFCTKSKPNCNACPMRGECRHFASAFASARLGLPAPEEKSIVGSTMPIATDRRADVAAYPMLLQLSSSNEEKELSIGRCEPIIEEPATPEPEITEIEETDIEDAFYEDPDEIPTIRLNVEQLAVNLRNFMEKHTDLLEEDMSKALVALAPEVASIPAPKLKYVLRLRTERQVYVLTDTHPLVKGLDKREPDDPSPYLLALLAPGEEASSDQPSGRFSDSTGSGGLCNQKECSSVDGEANLLTVRGTLLIPCRTAMRGSFPLNGTYFQVNEVFADHESSLKPIDVPREWLWHLETRTVFFGTSATSIFRGMTTKEIQNSFWRGFVCVRGFDQKTRAPRPLNRNLHLAQNKTVKTSNAAL